MKVLLLANYDGDGQESMQRFAACMARGLGQAGHEARIVRPPSLLGRLYRSGEGLGKWLGYCDKFIAFPLFLKSAIKWADVVHICDHANSFYTKYLRSVPNVVTCHDLLAVRSALGEIAQNPTRWTGRQLQRMILNGLTRAQHVACVSDATRRDLSRLSGLTEQRISRVDNSLHFPFSQMPEPEALARLRLLSPNLSRPFLLHVGGNQWYKNRLGALRIFFRLRKLVSDPAFKLVMVGKPWTAEMRRFVYENNMSEVTLELTAGTDEDLQALYSTASMILFPSLQEGFGWPIIEAQSCGCPVATSKRSPMVEVAGDAGIFIDPEDPESAAFIVQQALANGAGRREASLANAARFRSGMVASYLALYNRLCTEKKPGWAGEPNKSMARPSICATSGGQ